MVNFNFSYAPGTSVQQMVGFETAGRIWGSYLTDNVTVNLHVGVSSDLPGNVIGGALPGIRASQSYESIIDRLKADATSSDDQVAIKSFQGGDDYKARFDFFMLDTKSGRRNRSYDEAKSEVLNLTRANAKAMGFSLADGGTALDGVIVFGCLSGSPYSWNYDYTGSSVAPANSLDFLSTAIHEIGHILGFVSGVDKPGWLDNVVTDKVSQNEYKGYLDTRVTYTTALDLFRYSDATLGKNRNDLSYGDRGGAKYFSIDGKNAITEFSTGKDTNLGGDGHQASHWKSEGIMDPGLAPGTRETLSMLDLRAMDVIGWNLAPNAATLNLDLSALVGQSQQALANRSGQTVSSLNANPAPSSSIPTNPAPSSSIPSQNLTQDRSQDIEKMVKDSQVYEWGTTWRNPYRQVIDMLSREEVYSSFEVLEAKSPQTAASTTPETAGGRKATGQREISTQDLQFAPTRQFNHGISRISRIALNQPKPDQIGTTPAPSTTANPNTLEFSKGQFLGAKPGVSPSQQGQQLLRWEQSRYSDSRVRRYTDQIAQHLKRQAAAKSFQPSDTPESSEPSLDNME